MMIGSFTPQFPPPHNDPRRPEYAVARLELARKLVVRLLGLSAATVEHNPGGMYGAGIPPADYMQTVSLLAQAQDCLLIVESTIRRHAKLGPPKVLKTEPPPTETPGVPEREAAEESIRTALANGVCYVCLERPFDGQDEDGLCAECRAEDE